MALTCPSCRHPVEAPTDAGTAQVKCRNCGAWVQRTQLEADLAAVPLAVAVQPPHTPMTPASGAAIASLICSLIFFIPLVTQALGLGFGIYALVRRSRDGRRPAAAWAGVVLSLAVGLGWLLLLVNFSAMVGGRATWTPYAGPYAGYGGGRNWSEADKQARRRQRIEASLERIGEAVAAYRRDMARWPQRLDDLLPTYLSAKILNDIDPDRAATDKRLVTFLADVDPVNDPPDRIVAYSVEMKYDNFGRELSPPQRCVLRLNGQVEDLDTSVVEQDLVRRGHRPVDQPAPDRGADAAANQ